MKTTGPSLKHDNLSEAGETCDNTKWNFHYARSCYHHQYYPQRNYKAKGHRGPLAAGGECRGSGGTSVLVGGSQCPLHGASVSENSCREVCAEILACIPNVHAECSIFVLYMVKYIYTFICLVHFMQRKVFIYHFGEVCICCANQSIIIPVSYVPKVFPTSLPPIQGN